MIEFKKINCSSIISLKISFFLLFLNYRYKRPTKVEYKYKKYLHSLRALCSCAALDQLCKYILHEIIY